MNEFIFIFEIIITLFTALTFIIAPRILSMIFGYRSNSHGLARLLKWSVIDILINGIILIPFTTFGLNMGDSYVEKITIYDFLNVMPLNLFFIFILLLIDILFMYLGVALKDFKRINI